jgi:uncharacterized damage-inducible protein DinB
MARSLLDDAFDHHLWATLRLLDVCAKLGPEQLEMTSPGTYGSILETIRHLVGSDRWYLFRLSGERHPLIEEDVMDLAELRAAMEHNGAAWIELLAKGIDPDEVVSTVRNDGSETHASRGLRLAQVIHHGTDHRSQICTALTTLGIEPPGIDLWNFGEHAGRVKEVPATS